MKKTMVMLMMMKPEEVEPLECISFCQGGGEGTNIEIREGPGLSLGGGRDGQMKSQTLID